MLRCSRIIRHEHLETLVLYCNASSRSDVAGIILIKGNQMSASLTSAAKRPADVTRPPQNDAISTMASSGRAWWDMMFDLQRASLAPFSIFSPGARNNGAATHRTNLAEAQPH